LKAVEKWELRGKGLRESNGSGGTDQNKVY
jgi:hypothetical protein